MKSWILIVSYLSKDIWHRWLENPGSFLSRLLVASLLGSLLFGVHLAFRYSETMLVQQIANLGLHNVSISHYVAGKGVTAGTSGSVEPTLGHLSAYGRALHFRRLPGTANIDLLDNATVVIGGRKTYVDLAPWLVPAGVADAYLFTGELPEGIAIRATYERGEKNARTARAPRVLNQVFGERAILFLPEIEAPMLEESGYLESFILLGDAERIPDLAGLVESVELLLKKDGFDRAQVLSAADWMDDLERLQERQAVWGSWFGVFCGLVVALVYGSITALEYQQNAFLSALIRSFGISRGFVLMRYLVENVVLVTIAAGGAVAAIWLGLPMLEPLLEISSPEADSLRAALLNVSATWAPARWLLAGALVSALPVFLALRRPVGRVLG